MYNNIVTSDGIQCLQEQVNHSQENECRE